MNNYGGSVSFNSYGNNGKLEFLKMPSGNQIIRLFLIGGNYVHGMNNYGGSLLFNGNSNFVKFMKNFDGIQNNSFQSFDMKENSKMVNMSNKGANQIFNFKKNSTFYNLANYGGSQIFNNNAGGINSVFGNNNYAGSSQTFNSKGGGTNNIHGNTNHAGSVQTFNSYGKRSKF